MRYPDVVRAALATAISSWDRSAQRRPRVRVVLVPVPQEARP
jgi:hypothetical protein